MHCMTQQQPAYRTSTSFESDPVTPLLANMPYGKLIILWSILLKLNLV